MKKMIVMMSLVISASAFAGSIKVLEAPVSLQKDNASASFIVNKGVALVRVDLANGDVDSIDTTYREAVSGLSYNAQTKEVVLATAEGQVVCGERRFNYVWPTGNCTFSYEKISSNVDNGFEIKNVDFVNVYLNY